MIKTIKQPKQLKHPSTVNKGQSAELYIGLMSGTSVDGIDATLVDIRSPSDITVIDTQFTAFDAELRAQINTVALNNTALYSCSDSILHSKLADNYSQAVLSLIKKAGINIKDVRAIANHGQTVRHEPNATPPFSLQLGDPQLIANQTQISTACYFRQADLNVGGQGAPLMPAFHQAIFSDNRKAACYVLNIGGIANISLLGNTLLDQWIMQHHGKKYDDNGKWAQSGQCIPELLTCLLEDSYFTELHPKSTGTDYFNLNWLQQSYPCLTRHKPEDVQATLLSLTVRSIADSIKKLSSASSQYDIFICGGGAHNTPMINELERELIYANISTTDTIGIPADWVESAGFAWLGYCLIHGIPSNLPSVTGAKKKVVLGELFEPK